MPEHKHTPAPWSDGKLVCISGQDKAGLNLGFVMTGRDERYQECLANAHLICAAPDLLQALEELDAMYARAWDTTDGGLHFSAESVAKFEAAHEKACAAIAKATGQA